MITCIVKMQTRKLHVKFLVFADSGRKNRDVHKDDRRINKYFDAANRERYFLLEGKMVELEEKGRGNEEANELEHRVFHAFGGGQRMEQGG